MKNLRIKNHLCACENHILTAPGYMCDTCMGMVPEFSNESKTSDSLYNSDYFESLEQAKSAAGLAA